jgi:transposase
MELHTIGIDLGKTVFHLVGLNVRGEVVLRKKFWRTPLLRFTAKQRVELIGMEGHEVRLIRAQYVKPYVKTNKSDHIDAEAIAEAVVGPRCGSCPSRLTISWIYSLCIGCARAG